MLAQALLGAGLAGTYMPGLKELSDRTAGPRQSRAIAFYTSTFGIGSSLSLWMAGAAALALRLARGLCRRECRADRGRGPDSRRASRPPGRAVHVLAARSLPRRTA